MLNVFFFTSAKCANYIAVRVPRYQWHLVDNVSWKMEKKYKMHAIYKPININGVYYLQRILILWFV